MSAHKGYATIFVILIFTIPFVLLYLAAWAPWVSLDFARQKALASMDKSCSELSSNEYSDTNPYEMRSLTLGEQLGLNPPFGQDVTLYVLCGETSFKNTYFVSFIGSVALKESIPIPHGVLEEQPQNTIEKLDETESWKEYESTELRFSIKYPQDLNIGQTNKTVSFNNGKDVKDEAKHIGISVTRIDSLKSLENYLKDLYPINNSGLPAFETEVKNGNITKIKIDGSGGYVTSKGMAFENQEKIIWVQHKDAVFIFIASGGGETGTSYTKEAEKVFDQVVSTFKFLN